MQLPHAVPCASGQAAPAHEPQALPSLAGGSLSLVLGLGRPVSLTDLLSLVVGRDLWNLGLPPCCVLGRGLLVGSSEQCLWDLRVLEEYCSVTASPVTLPTCPQPSVPWPAPGAQRALSLTPASGPFGP